MVGGEGKNRENFDSTVGKFKKEIRNKNRYKLKELIFNFKLTKFQNFKGWLIKL